MLPAIRLTAVLAFAATAAAYEVGGPVNDLRFHGGIQMAPKVKEKSTSYQYTNPANNISYLSPVPTGQVDLEWQETRRSNFFVGVDYVKGWANGRRGAHGLAWGVGLHWAEMNMAPDSYTATSAYGTTTYKTVRQPKGLDFRELGASFQLQYASRPRDIEYGEMHWELGGFARGGPLKGTTESTLTKGSAATGYYQEQIRVSDWGWWGEFGPQAGIYLVDKGWLVGLTAEWALGGGKVVFDNIPNGDTNEITLTRNGVGGSLVVGGRF